jgi:predicted dehydrogenase
MVAVARRHGLALIEDCAQAHFTEYKGRFVGTIGDIGCFSFQQSKHMTTGDGGMTITSNAAYHERMKLFADKGYARKGWGSRAYLFHAPNYRMTELVGAVGVAQLGKVRGVIEKRRQLAEQLNGLLSKIGGVEPAPVTAGAKPSYWQYAFDVPGVPAEAVAAEMARQKVFAMAGYTGKPIYLCSESLTAKRTYGTSEWPFNANPGVTYEYTEGLCPKAEARLKHLVTVPIDESCSPSYIERVAAVVGRTMEALAAGTTTTPVSAARPAPVAAPRAGSAKKVRVAIVGCGQMGRWHLDSYKSDPRVDVVACVDTARDRAEAFARETGGRAYTSHADMLANEGIDAVSLCSVPSSHRDITVDLLRSGAHVLCEKPLAVTVAEAEEMSRAAKAQNRLLFTAFKFRFHDEVRKAKELIESGSLGRVLNFRLMFGGYIDMRGQWYGQKALAGGGIIMDNGPHAADLMRYLFGCDVKSVTAQVSHIQGLEVEDTAKLDVCLANETLGTGDLSWTVRIPPRSYLEIYGEDGAALLDGEGISYRFKTWSEWKREPNAVDVKGALARQIHYFVGATLGDNPLGLGNGEGVASQRVIEAAYASVQMNRRVDVSTGDLVAV